MVFCCFGYELSTINHDLILATIILQLESLIYKTSNGPENIAAVPLFTGDYKKSKIILPDKMV
jgi:hypothetical protein